MVQLGGLSGSREQLHGRHVLQDRDVRGEVPDRYISLRLRRLL